MVSGEHVQHFMQMSNELEKLQQQAPAVIKGEIPENMDPMAMRFFGQMTKDQMKRLVPGFIRVEVLVDEAQYGAQSKLDPINVDHQYPGLAKEQHVDPSVCCHASNFKGTPATPPPDDVIIWETAAKALGLRHVAGSDWLDWLVLLPGPGKKMKKNELMGSYWTGRDGAFPDERYPTGGMPDLIAQQGGWMATRKQLVRLDQGLCMSHFLPPFERPEYYEDGQQSMNVEYWSGGYQYFTGVRGGCNMQRVVSLKHFSKHLLYHTANNKQKQLTSDRMLRANNLYGQLITTLKSAIKAKEGMENAKRI